jgi:hypothetical protein
VSTKKNKVNEQNNQAELTYTKAQFLASKQFTAIQRDFLNAILEDGKTYTMDQVKQLIEEYAKKAVK